MENCEGEWVIKRLEVGGFGRRFGTTPLGQRARAFHLESTSFPTPSASDGENCSSSWQSPS